MAPIATVCALLLDLDGTILDHEAALRTAILDALQDSPLPHDVDASIAISRWCDIETHHFQRYLDGELTFEEQRIVRTREFLASYGVRGLDRSALLRWFDRYRGFYEKAWHAFDDVHPFLQAVASLESVPLLAVVTNGDQEQQALKLDSMGLGWMRLYTSSVLGFRKPDRAAFLRVCTELEIEPAQAWFIGDNREVDAQGTEAAGLHGVWLDRRSGAARFDGLCRASTLMDVIDLIGGAQ